jgi:CubicO group peptidase (beta-lactamase class C family)
MKTRCVVVASLLIETTAKAAAQVIGNPDPAVGLWGGERVFGPRVRGEVVVHRRGDQWHMRAGGFEVRAAATADSLAITLPGGAGTLRGWVRGRTLEGYWIQPAGMAIPSYSTPIRFREVAPVVWVGHLEPLEERFSLYLSIAPMADGSLRGIFRNPEMNWPGRSVIVQREAGVLALIDPRTQRVRFRQPWDSVNRTIQFDFGQPVMLTPQTPATAVGFTARAASLSDYAYRQPVPGSDGWRIARAEAAGVRENALREIVRRIIRADPLDDTEPRVHSLLVARHGRLVLDEYFHGFSAERLHDMRSATKTVTSIMLGVAARRGASLSVRTAIDTTARLRDVTIGSLLTHTSGLACDDDDDASPGNEDRMQSQSAMDWYRYTMTLPRIHQVGTTYAYCSGGVNLVGRAIASATSSWLPAFFDRNIGGPLQFGAYAMNLMPDGQAYAAGGMYLRPRDFLKLGQLYLAGGVWNGRRIVSRSWVNESTSWQVGRPDGSTDGFGWHRHALSVDGSVYQTFEASGNGGQIVLVVPALDLVLAVTAGNYGEYAVWQRLRTELAVSVMRAVR